MVEESRQTAKADDSHDGRYTHQSAASPGMPGGPPAPAHTEYPKWVTPKGGGDPVVVQDPDEEVAVAGHRHKAAKGKKVKAAKGAKRGRKPRAKREHVPAPTAEDGRVNLFVLLLLVAFFAVFGAWSASAQTTVTQTTLAAALAAPAPGAPATTVILASATGISTPSATGPGSVLYFDKEAVRVQSLVTGATFTVTRGQLGTASAAHASGAIVFAGPSSGSTASPFVSVDPSGVCVAASQPYTLQINPRTGNIWACTPTTVTLGTSAATVSIWASWGFVPEFITVPRANVAGNVSAVTGGYTIKVTDYIVALTTTNTGTDTINGKAAPVTTFYLPSHAGLAGKVLVLKDESGGVGATTFINIFGTIDGATSAQLKTPFGSLTVYAGSGGWFTISCWASGCR
jgi:hypothetical protein